MSFLKHNFCISKDNKEIHVILKHNFCISTDEKKNTCNFENIITVFFHGWKTNKCNFENLIFFLSPQVKDKITEIMWKKKQQSNMDYECITLVIVP